jgi:hypothetical protein
MACYKRIASEIIPERYQENATKAGNVVKGKWEECVYMLLFDVSRNADTMCGSIYGFYKDNIADLQGTGSGIKDDEDQPYYMPAGGPNEQTPAAARNIWGAHEFLIVVQHLANCLFRSEDKAEPRVRSPARPAKHEAQGRPTFHYHWHRSARRRDSSSPGAVAGRP